MDWSSHEFIWLDWVVLAVGLCGVVAAVWYAIWKDKKSQKGEDSSAYLFGKALAQKMAWVWLTGRCRAG